MSWFPSLGEIAEAISNTVDRYLARDERDRIAAARARAVYELRLAEQRAAKATAAVEAARARALRAAEADDLYESAEAERAASAADGNEP